MIDAFSSRTCLAPAIRGRTGNSVKGKTWGSSRGQLTSALKALNRQERRGNKKDLASIYSQLASLAGVPNPGYPILRAADERYYMDINDAIKYNQYIFQRLKFGGVSCPNSNIPKEARLSMGNDHGQVSIHILEAENRWLGPLRPRVHTNLPPVLRPGGTGVLLRWWPRRI
jgi:hypothetical protein